VAIIKEGRSWLSAGEVSRLKRLSERGSQSSSEPEPELRLLRRSTSEQAPAEKPLLSFASRPSQEPSGEGAVRAAGSPAPPLLSYSPKPVEPEGRTGELLKAAGAGDVLRNTIRPAQPVTPTAASAARESSVERRREPIAAPPEPPLDLFDDPVPVPDEVAAPSLGPSSEPPANPVPEKAGTPASAQPSAPPPAPPTVLPVAQPPSPPGSVAPAPKPEASVPPEPASPPAPAVTASPTPTVERDAALSAELSAALEAAERAAQQVHELHRRCAQLEQRNQELEATCNRLKAGLQETEATLKRNRNARSNLENEVIGLQDQLGKARTRIEALEREVQHLGAELERAEDAHNSELRRLRSKTDRSSEPSREMSAVSGGSPQGAPAGEMEQLRNQMAEKDRLLAQEYEQRATLRSQLEDKQQKYFELKARYDKEKSEWSELLAQALQNQGHLRQQLEEMKARNPKGWNPFRREK
jgi:hypothetical protein